MSTMVEILQRIIATRGAGCPEGICRELAGANDLNWDGITGIWAGWEHFSGSPSCPVPDPGRPGDPDAAWSIWFEEEENRWAGPYGELRLKLAAYLLEALS